MQNKNESKQSTKLWGVIIGLGIFIVSELRSEGGFMTRPVYYFIFVFSLVQLYRLVRQRVRDKSLETSPPKKEPVIEDDEYAFNPEDYTW